MKRLSFFLALLVSSVSAFADAPTAKYYFTSYPNTFFNSGQEACNAFQGLGGFPSSWTVTGYYGHVQGGTGNDSYCHFYGTGMSNKLEQVLTKNFCANGSSPDTSKPLNQQCPDHCPAAGTDGPKLEYTSGWRTGPDANSAWASGDYTIPDSGCYNGCTVRTYNDGNPWIKDAPGPNGYYEAGWDLTSMYTSGTCTGTNIGSSKPPEPSAPPPEKNRCPNGTKQTGIDSAGTPICTGNPPKDPATGNKETSTSNKTNPDGSKTTTTTETTTNSDGSKTTKTTTTTTSADGTSTSGTTTTATGNDPSGKPGVNDGDKSDMCKQFPTLTICRNSQISGTCDKVSCDGDAIQCAIARKQAEDSCKREEQAKEVEESAAKKLGELAAGGDDPLKKDFPHKKEGDKVELPTSLDASGWLGGGSCFPDRSFSVRGVSFAIPFSKVCNELIAFRYAIMLVALLAAFRTVSGTMLRE